MGAVELTRIPLERGKTALEALQVMIDLIEEFG